MIFLISSCFQIKCDLILGQDAVEEPGPILACIITQSVYYIGPLCNIKNENVQH